MSERIRESDWPRHSDAIAYFNVLILDLKKQLLGLAHEPITMERLNESQKHFNDLDECKEPTRFYR